MPRKPVSIEVIEEGDERYVLLTYANGETVQRRVERERNAVRRPRMPPTRLKLPPRKER